MGWVTLGPTSSFRPGQDDDPAKEKTRPGDDPVRGRPGQEADPVSGVRPGQEADLVSGVRPGQEADPVSG